MSTIVKCFNIPSLISYGICLLLFIFSYLLYRITLAILRRCFHKNSFFYLLFLKNLKHWFLVIFLEIALFVSLDILDFGTEFAGLINHFMIIIIIISAGWLAVQITRTLYHHFIGKIEKEETIVFSKRSMVTQALFTYRLVMVTIIVITVAAVLMTIPYIKSIGVGLLGSAGIAGLAVGMAARPMLLNLLAGFQIAATKVIKIGDAVHVEGEFARIEVIHLTHVVVRTWDLRRLVLPISYFIDKPFQNWDITSPELLGVVLLYCDYTISVEVIRTKVKELINNSDLWNGHLSRVQVTNFTETTMEVRIVVSADDAAKAFQLRCYVREHLIAFLQKEHPSSLPCVRYRYPKEGEVF